MDKGNNRSQVGIVLDFFAQEIFNRFDVVIGGALDGLDARGGLEVESCDNGIEFCQCGHSQCWQFGDSRLGSEDFQPFDFNQHAVADQPEFAAACA